MGVGKFSGSEDTMIYLLCLQVYCILILTSEYVLCKITISVFGCLDDCRSASRLTDQQEGQCLLQTMQETLWLVIEQ